MPIPVGLAPVLFQARSTANQALTASGTWYPVALDVEDYDDAGAHSTSSNTSRFVAPRAGLYTVSGEVTFTGGTASTLRQLGLWKNTTMVPGTFAAAYPTAAGVYYSVYILPTTVTMAAGDYVEMQAQASSTGASLVGNATDYGCMLHVESR